MKIPILHLLALIAGLGLMLTGRVKAQTFTTLHSFSTASDTFPWTNSDGLYPSGELIMSGNTLYGTAHNGGSSGWGVVFAVNTDGTGFTNLHPFAFSDGAGPGCGLTLSGKTLYGTTSRGGNPGFGTVFAVNTDGTGFTNLHTFPTFSGPDYTNSDGANLLAELILSGNTLYGTAYWGGSSGNGTVFKLNTDGTGFTNLHSFGPPHVPHFAGGNNRTNNDGANPSAGLILSGNTLYGTAEFGGSLGNGTVFAVNTDGSGFTNLHSFTTTSAPDNTNSDGAQPAAGLILSDNTLYGTAQGGGSSGRGTVFAINTDGTGFTNLHSFATASDTLPWTNSDGVHPSGGLILSGNTLYGTAVYGGSSGNGTVFAISTDGTGFTTLYSFTASYDINSDGIGPQAGVILSGNTLYGTAVNGGNFGYGTVFSLSFAPQLTIIPSDGNVILTWPTNYAGFDYSGFTLQSGLAITGTFTNIPGATSPCTNPISGSQGFFRLSSN